MAVVVAAEAGTAEDTVDGEFLEQVLTSSLVWPGET
jgi:hypothetical protein